MRETTLCACYNVAILVHIVAAIITKMAGPQPQKISTKREKADGSGELEIRLEHYKDKLQLHEEEVDVQLEALPQLNTLNILNESIEHLTHCKRRLKKCQRKLSIYQLTLLSRDYESFKKELKYLKQELDETLKIFLDTITRQKRLITGTFGLGSITAGIATGVGLTLLGPVGVLAGAMIGAAVGSTTSVAAVKGSGVNEAVRQLERTVAVLKVCSNTVEQCQGMIENS